MKILLINPPQSFYPGADPPAGNLPLGLLYIAAVLDQAGYEVEVLDAFIEGVRFRGSNASVDIGMPYAEIQAEVRRRKPDVVGVSNPFSSQVENAVRTVNLVKQVDPTILTVVGGPHVTTVPVKFMKECVNVDVAVIGEGEYTMLDILKAKQGRKKLDEVLGIAYRENGEVTLNPPRPFIKNLDMLPYPAYHLVNMEQYLNPRKVEYRSFKPRAISMITSRGCPFNCNFCAVHLHMGRAFRAHSADYVVRHIEHVVTKYGVRTIFFEDDNLTYDLKRFERICDTIIQKGLRFKWETPNGVRADYLTKSLLEKMKRAGCQSLFFGIESGQQHILDKVIDKRLSLKAVVNVAKICQEIGLKTAAFYIIGFPGETKTDMLKTAEFALRLKKDFDVGILLHAAAPSYGTRLCEECLKKGYIPKELTPRTFAEGRQPWGNPVITTEDFTPADVRTIALKTMEKYKKLCIISYIKNPRKTLKTALDQPKLMLKFVKDLLFTWKSLATCNDTTPCIR